MYDMKKMARFKRYAEVAPELLAAFQTFDQAAFAPGAIPPKYKELIAVAVALTTQCPYCIEIHADKARKADASEKEMIEAIMIAAAIRAGGSMTHGTHTLG